MDIDVTTDWTEVQKQSVELGDLFAAKMARVDIVALMSEDVDGNRFALVLDYRGADTDLARFPPPAGRSLSTIGLKVRLYKGKVEANALPEARGDGSFPVHRTEPQHGDLVVDKDGGAWIYVEDHMVESHPPMRFFLNLRTGRMGSPMGTTLHRDWELAIQEQGSASVVRTFGTL